MQYENPVATNGPTQISPAAQGEEPLHVAPNVPLHVPDSQMRLVPQVRPSVVIEHKRDSVRVARAHAPDVPDLSEEELRDELARLAEEWARWQIIGS